ncbi:MAG: hypothetical protein IKI94_04285 [Ruminococcus sp.]|nr:hypothetical protein [Ruminococcus sp.]
MESHTIDLKMSEIFERIYFDTDISKRTIYEMIKNTMETIGESAGFMDSDTLFKGGNKNGAYKFRYETADLFYVLNKQINRLDKDYTKDSEFYNIRRYYDHVFNAEKELRSFQKYVVDKLADENHIEYEIRNYNEIYNSISAIISYMGENKNNEIIIEIINNNLKQSVKNIILESERIKRSGQKRFMTFEKGYGTKLAKKILAEMNNEKPKEDSSTDDLEMEDLFDFKNHNEDLPEINKVTLAQTINDKYMNAIMYIIDTFYYDPYDSREKHDDKSEFYKHKMKSFPYRKPLSEIYKEISRSPSENEIRRYDEAWKKYMECVKFRFRASNSSEWDAYCKSNNISDENMSKEVRIEGYKEKRFLSNDLKKIREELDHVFLDLLMEKLPDNTHGNITTKLKQSEITDVEQLLNKMVNNIFSMINECHNKYNIYDSEKLFELGKNEHFFSSLDNLIYYSITDISISGYISETVIKLCDLLSVGNSNSLKIEVPKLQQELQQKIEEYISVLREISSDGYFDEQEISFKALMGYRDMIHSMLNIHLNCRMGDASLLCMDGAINSFSIRSFPFKETLQRIDGIIDNYVNSYGKWNEACIEKIVLFDPKTQKEKYDKYKEYDNAITKGWCPMYADANDIERIRMIYIRHIVAEVRKYLVECYELQKKYVELKTSLNLNSEIKLCEIFDKALGL